jgi:hypothetical protein
MQKTIDSLFVLTEPRDPPSPDFDYLFTGWPSKNLSNQLEELPINKDEKDSVVKDATKKASVKKLDSKGKIDKTHQKEDTGNLWTQTSQNKKRLLNICSGQEPKNTLSLSEQGQSGPSSLHTFATFSLTNYPTAKKEIADYFRQNNLPQELSRSLIERLLGGSLDNALIPIGLIPKPDKKNFMSRFRVKFKDFKGYSDSPLNFRIEFEALAYPEISNHLCLTFLRIGPRKEFWGTQDEEISRSHGQALVEMKALDFLFKKAMTAGQDTEKPESKEKILKKIDEIVQKTLKEFDAKATSPEKYDDQDVMGINYKVKLNKTSYAIHTYLVKTTKVFVVSLWDHEENRLQLILAEGYLKQHYYLVGIGKERLRSYLRSINGRSQSGKGHG